VVVLYGRKKESNTGARVRSGGRFEEAAIFRKDPLDNCKADSMRRIRWPVDRTGARAGAQSRRRTFLKCAGDKQRHIIARAELTGSTGNRFLNIGSIQSQAEDLLC
jgi:hypothetical protein